MVNMVSISGSAAPSRKKNVARILTLSILAMAFMFWGEFGFDFLLGRDNDNDESAIGIISRRFLQNNEPRIRNQSAIDARKRRKERARRLDRQQRSLNDAKDSRQAQQALRDPLSEQRSLTNLLSFIDPKSTVSRVKTQERERARLIAEVEATQHTLMAVADADIAGGYTTFRVVPRNEDVNALFSPSEILIEVVNPRPDCRYSVTVVSHGKYTGSAMLLTEASFVYSWRPVFPERYEVLVHEIDQIYIHETPLIQKPFPVIISERHQAEGVAASSGLSILNNRIQNAPPCQTVNQIDLYSHWDGDWLGPDFQLEESIRTGWSFVPSSRMNCKLETFDSNVIRAIPEKKSIYILGRSVERGIFLSLIDLMLEKTEGKKYLKTSWIGKCWGRASVSRGNLEVMYQDFRVNSFEDPTEPQFLECHNDKLVKEAGSSFIVNATKIWEEIFQQDEADWPSVIFLVAGLGSANFQFKHHVQPFVTMLPPTWQGTLFMGDFEFSGRGGGLVSLPKYEFYLSEINSMVNQLNDPRVRWIDGNGIAKEMRMHSQKGENFIGRSQHFHRPCFRKDPDNQREVMAVCSNITEMVGQLLLGHALGPKDELMERVKQNPTKPDSTMRWCHACPKCMIPFHITPYPKMTCIEGPIVDKAVFDDCSGERFAVHDKEAESKDPLTCPDSCLESPVTSEFGSETDTVYVRQCPI